MWVVKTWRRVPHTVRAVVVGLAVTVGGTAPWALLAPLNARLSPQLPWAGPLCAAWIWIYWRHLSGPGPPRATAALRRERLRARALPAATWAWALLATTSAFAALISLALAANRLLPLQGPARLSDLDRYPLALVLTGLLTTAVVAAVTEEAGFRGYMQSALDRRLGAVHSSLLVAAVFALIHLSHGPEPSRLVINAAASLVPSLTVRRTGSILPWVVVHAASGILVPFSLWASRGIAWPQAMQSRGPGAFVGILCVIATALAALAALAYAHLRSPRGGAMNAKPAAGPLPAGDAPE